MRDILFKAKRIDNGEWVEGLLTVMWGQYHIINPNDENTAYPIVSDTVCQYTGLTDKNGQKIWENDIVDASSGWWDASGPAGHDSPIIQVEWDDGFAEFAPFVIYDCDCGVYIESEDVKVIGNIFDNPELLKEGVNHGKNE